MFLTNEYYKKPCLRAIIPGETYFLGELVDDESEDTVRDILNTRSVCVDETECVIASFDIKENAEDPLDTVVCIDEIY